MKSEPSETSWYRLSAEDVEKNLSVDVASGLSSSEAKSRLETYGPNVITTKEKEPGWKAFLRQYQDFMQIVLVVAAVGNQLVTHDRGTTVVLLLLTLFNAVMGLRQEAKAEASLAALQGMMKQITRVRRDGQAIEVDASQVVPGDIVLVEAGNVVPADGRLFVAATLEIEEAALTGESVPTLKDTAAIDAADVALGDQQCMAFMNTSVTRGRGELIVTTTGMKTEMGHIGTMLNNTTADKTPLQKQLDSLTKIIAAFAGLALVFIVGVGIYRGESFDTVFTTGIALAVAAIPTGLPAVVTTLLSLGTRQLAEQNAIMKRLPAVETLGSTSAICSDKTGTLTLNKMTARELVIPGEGNVFKISGEGYGTTGDITHAGGKNLDLDPFLLPMVLCADATLDGEELIGDPTEGALIVLGAKGGLDIEQTRAEYPRIAEVPFDSAYKFMATFHNMTNSEGKPVVRAYVKGAPDVLISRGSEFWTAAGGEVAVEDEHRKRALSENDRLAGSGQRVMVVAQRDFDPATFDPQAPLIDSMKDLTLLAMVGIVDPPRPEARAAIEECKSAGIRVRMITGDHATTAAAIGSELGIYGRALTGAQFADMSDEELLADMENIGVIARVAPEDKIRLVRLLQESGEIVAMTGDGVNDAPALKKADIGVAMGITGTEVSKGAAVMILTDDNFSTIVNAVEYGRSLYDNLIKYLRFQMVSLIAFIAVFVGATILNIASGRPLNPVQILWLNFAIDVPLAVALGFDTPTAGLMLRRPRRANAPVFTRPEWIRLAADAAVMTIGVLALYQYMEDDHGVAVAATMLLTSLTLFHIVMGLCARSNRESALSRDSIPGWNQARFYLMALLLTLLATEVGFLQRALDTVSLSVNQWLVCAGVALTLLLFEEIVKFYERRKQPAAEAEITPATQQPSLNVGVAR